MRVIRKLADRFRDKSRDELVHALNALGVSATMAERGRPEEELKRRGSSLGLIDIAQGPVKWINVVSHTEGNASGSGKTTYWYVFGIPDERGSSSGREGPQVELSTVSRKTFPMFGSVTGVEWKGYDGGRGLTSALAMAPEVEALCKRSGDLYIRLYQRAFQGWTVEMKGDHLSSQDWSAVEAIARILVSSG